MYWFCKFAGNEVIFSLETASDYVKDEKASFFGFKCLIVGYEWGAKPEEVTYTTFYHTTFYHTTFCQSVNPTKDMQVICTCLT